VEKVKRKLKQELRELSHLRKKSYKDNTKKRRSVSAKKSCLLNNNVKKRNVNAKKHLKRWVRMVNN